MGGEWQKSQISAFQDALSSITGKIGLDAFKQLFDKTRVIVTTTPGSGGGAEVIDGDIYLDKVFWNKDINGDYVDQVFRIVHEFGHVWDFRRNWNLNALMQVESDSHYYLGPLPIQDICTPGWYGCNFQPGPGPSCSACWPPANAVEDYAQAFADYVLWDRVSNHPTFGFVYSEQQRVMRFKLLEQLLVTPVRTR